MGSLTWLRSPSQLGLILKLLERFDGLYLEIPRRRLLLLFLALFGWTGREGVKFGVRGRAGREG